MKIYGIMGLDKEYKFAMADMRYYYENIIRTQEDMMMSAMVAANMAHKPGWREAYIRNQQGANKYY